MKRDPTGGVDQTESFVATERLHLMVARAVGSAKSVERVSERVSLSAAAAANAFHGHLQQRAAFHRAARHPHRAETATRNRRAPTRRGDSFAQEMHSILQAMRRLD